MKSIKKLSLSLAALMICGSVTSLADDSLKWTGSMRTGGAYNTELQNTTKSDVNHLGKYGNEFDTYISSTLTKTWKNEVGEWAEYSLEIDMLDNDSDKSEVTWRNNSNFLRMGGFNFMQKDTSVWIGTRNQETEIYILDYNWRRLKGTGLGIETKNYDLQLLSSDSGYDTTASSTGGDVEATTLAARYRLGALEAELVYTKAAKFDDVTYDNDSAFTLSANYIMDSYYGLVDGASQLIVQIGSGLEADQLGSEMLSKSKDKAQRAALNGVFNIVEGTQMATVFLYESTDFDDTSKENASYIVAGTRITYEVDQNFLMNFEGVVTSVENENGVEAADGIKYKASIGPTLKMAGKSILRPEMRLMATFIGGDKKVSSLNEDNDASEFRIGYEMEAQF